MKTDFLGNQIWKIDYDDNTEANSFSLIETNDGGFAISGTMQYKTLLVKTDSQGNITSLTNVQKNSISKLEKVFDMLGRETSIKSNQFLIYNYDDGTVEKRIILD